MGLVVKLTIDIKYQFKSTTRPSALGMSDTVMEILETQEFPNILKILKGTKGTKEAKKTKAVKVA